jgi:hypothetical protein
MGGRGASHRLAEVEQRARRAPVGDCQRNTPSGFATTVRLVGPCLFVRHISGTTSCRCPGRPRLAKSSLQMALPLECRCKPRAVPLVGCPPQPLAARQPVARGEVLLGVGANGAGRATSSHLCQPRHLDQRLCVYGDCDLQARQRNGASKLAWSTSHRQTLLCGANGPAAGPVTQASLVYRDRRMARQPTCIAFRS